jgi:hypothetical protein
MNDETRRPLRFHPDKRAMRPEDVGRMLRDYQVDAVIPTIEPESHILGEIRDLALDIRILSQTFRAYFGGTTGIAAPNVAELVTDLNGVIRRMDERLAKVVPIAEPVEGEREVFSPDKVAEEVVLRLMGLGAGEDRCVREVEGAIRKGYEAGAAREREIIEAKKRQQGETS